jgi:precorrin-6B methylase 2
MTNNIFDTIKLVDGSLTNGDIQILHKLSKDVPENGVIVEIGCYYGKSSCLIFLSKHESVKMYSIDNFSGTERDQSSDQYEKMVKNMVAFNFYPRLIHGTSECANLFENNSIDLLFIDGCHQYDWVLKDITNFLHKMKSPSVMCGHDWQTYQDVNKAVRQVFNNNKIITNLSSGSSIWQVSMQ